MQANLELSFDFSLAWAGFCTLFPHKANGNYISCPVLIDFLGTSNISKLEVRQF